MFDSTKVGKRIKELRGQISQDKCAESLGISRGALSFYENGDRKPDAEVIYRMCEYFNVSTDYLLGLSDVQSVNTDIQTACKVTGLSEPSVKALKEFYIERKKNKDPDEYMSTDSINALLKAVLINEKALEYITNVLNIDYVLFDMCATAESQKEVDMLNETNIKFKVLSYPEYLKFCENTAKNELNKVIDMIVHERFGDLVALKERELNANNNQEG